MTVKRVYDTGALLTLSQGQLLLRQGSISTSRLWALQPTPGFHLL